MREDRLEAEAPEIPEPMLYYRVLSQSKETNVFPNGYGLVRFETSIQVTRPEFSGPVHYFAFSNSIAASQLLPTVQEVGQGTVLDAGRRPFVNYRLLHPTSRGFGMKPTELRSQSSGRMRVFQFQVSPRCDVGQEITYAWEWGQPSLFDTSPGAEETSSYRCLVPTDELKAELRFYHPAGGRRVLFEREPALLYRAAQSQEEVVLGARGIELLDYVVFRWLIGVAHPQDQAIASWKNNGTAVSGE
ncbi:hypothetical protein ACFLTM_04085 [Candidatus Bipolaricaulota bacterium]